MHIAGLLLAAGQSRRFGSNKLLHPLSNGQPMAEVSASQLKQACDTAYALVSEMSSPLVDVFRNQGLEIILNRHASHGIGSSIAAGVKHTPLADAWVIALADMPGIDARTYQLLLQTFKKQATDSPCIIAPSYQGQRGHPVIFSAHFYQYLSKLNTDRGARAVIQQHPQYLKQIQTNDIGVVQDVDNKEDILHIKQA